MQFHLFDLIDTFYISFFVTYLNAQYVVIKCFYYTKIEKLQLSILSHNLVLVQNHLVWRNEFTFLALQHCFY